MNTRPICATETVLENLVAASLSRFSFHNDPTVMPGIPDRYVVGGNWIEFKNEITFDRTSKALNRQRKWLSLLHNASDKAWVCALIGELLYLEQWNVWREREKRRIGRLVQMGGSPFSVTNQDAIICTVRYVFHV